GVGKTTACRSFIDRHPEWILLSASGLIKTARQLSEAQLRFANSNEILGNQQLLVSLVRNELAHKPDGKFLFDGQCLIDNGTTLVEVPLNVVQMLRPSGILFITAPAPTIFNRRSLDARQRPFRTSDELAAHQEKAHLQACRYAEAVRVPISFLELIDGALLDQPIRTVLQKINSN
ncbi:MAG: AAA family ATPase, partial [Xanthobacteraceae bacterium]